ncbi:reverse transcriptase domain-containing protein [Tanacetum coccineum]
MLVLNALPNARTPLDSLVHMVAALFKVVHQVCFKVSLQEVDDLTRMYKLFSKIPEGLGLDPVAKMFTQHVTAEGLTLVQQADNAASNKFVARTPNSAIVQPNVDDNFVINSTHLNMIRENKFDGYLRADPHDHIREFLAIYNMFRYGETHSEAVNLLIFPFSLSDEAKTWFNELNKGSITSWEQIRRAFINRFFPPSLFNRLLLENRNFSQNVCESLTDAWLRLKNMLQKCHGHSLTKGAIIQIFYHGLDEPTQAILDGTARGIFLYKSPNQAFQFLEDKVLLEHEWPIKSKTEHHQKSVSFADGSDSNTDNSRLIEKLEALTLKMDSQF